MGKVLIVGLDGGTWRLFERWCGMGRCPVLNSLMEKGAWGSLRSTVPPLTLPAWSSMMTGQNPGAHGVYAFRRMLPGEYRTGGLASSADLRVKTLWELAGEAGKSVGVINVPPSYPIRPINGFVIGCMLTPPGEPYTNPPELATEIGEYQIDLPAPRGLRHDDDDLIERGLPYLQGLRRQTELRTRATLKLMKRPWDLLCVVYYAPDRIQHYFWPDLDDPDRVSDSRIRTALEDAYTTLDRSLGDLLAKAGEDTTVILVSDHGFRPKPEQSVHLNRWLADCGFLRERPFWRLRRRLLRKVLSADQRARRDTVDQIVDMSRTRAWAQTLEPGTTGVWINLKGRYPSGCVSDDTYEQVRMELLHKMRALRDGGGRRVFEAAWKREDLYTGAHVALAPDIVAVCTPRIGVIYESVRRDLRSRSLFGPFSEMGFTGSHDGDGMYLIVGPDVQSLGHHREYPIESIAPTVLYLLGLPVPRSMNAEMLTSTFQGAFLANHPVLRSDETTTNLATSDAAWKSAEDEARIADHLRGLGYVE